VDEEFLELISLTDRIHRRFLHLVKAELEQLAVHGINPTQALILLKIGHLAMSPTELVAGGWYPGTNPSYSVKRLVDGGLITRERRTRDRRSNALRLTEKGHHLRRLLIALYRRQQEQGSDRALIDGDLAEAAGVLRRLEQSLESVAETGPDAHRGASHIARRGAPTR